MLARLAVAGPARGGAPLPPAPVAAMPPNPLPPPLRRRAPLLLRSAGWRLGVACVLGALLVLLWRCALAGGG